MRLADEALLKKTRLFREVGETVGERLVRNCIMQDFAKDAVLTQQGEASEFVHLILTGRVALTAECCDGGSTIITMLGAGDIFVGAAAILSLPYLVTAKAAAQSRILLIPSERFRLALKTEHALTLMMLNNQAEYWRLLVNHLRELKLHSGLERLAHYIVRQSPQQSGSVRFRLSCDRKIIAAELGMSPEFLSRNLQQLRQYGIRASGGMIEIDNVERAASLYRPILPADRPRL